ncbi:hypothetical protein HK100_005316 [Physocladia obscura]|uniref:L domain-like protein n=1 Tax=Physocladia obscura TaxID=109957 RepID=A0AAD5SRW8_9FUNG|nr:hypothetical protein HK100_005316 [Physocladia obscura]
MLVKMFKFHFSDFVFVGNTSFIEIQMRFFSRTQETGSTGTEAATIETRTGIARRPNALGRLGDTLRTNARARWILVFAVAVFAVAIGWLALYNSGYFGNDNGNGSSYSSLDGCFDSSTGSIYEISSNVDSAGNQCQAVLTMATLFGFPSATSCSQNVFAVHNPPKSLGSVPSPLINLTNLAGLGIHNALYGNSILESLFAVIQVPRYFTALNISGVIDSPSATRVINGTLPSLPNVLASQTAFFTTMSVSNNNLTGSIPANYADNFVLLDVSNNAHLSGALPSSISQNKTGTPEWTLMSYCNFNGTELCVPAIWPYQPSCIRYVSSALQTCDGGAALGIDPNSPVTSSSSSSSSSWWSFGDGFGGQLIWIGVIGILGGAFFAYQIRRNRQRQGQQGNISEDPYVIRRPGDLELEMRRIDELNLPAYMPEVPKYVMADDPPVSDQDKGEKNKNQDLERSLSGGIDGNAGVVADDSLPTFAASAPSAGNQTSK